MDDAQLLRYSRHILLDEWGVEAQQRILSRHALIVGVGGLGSPVALYLAGAGVGRITLVDADSVDLTNLQRQIAHATGRVGTSKVESAGVAMRAINPEIDITAVAAHADAALLDELVPAADVVIDCTDNFSTRHLINAACVRHGKPLVSGSAIRFDAQLSVFDTRDAACPCYACVFPPSEQFEETSCATLGVFSPLVGIIGSMQAAEALKVLAAVATPLTGRLLMLDARTMAVDEMRIARRDDCPVCATRSPAPA